MTGERRGFSPVLSLAAALGAATVLGFAPFYLYPLPVITLALLFRLASGARPPRAAALGFAFGLGLFGLGTSWVYVSLHDFGAMPALLAAFATALFCAGLALFPAAAAYFSARLPAPRGMRLVLLAPGLWVAAEWVRGWIFTGFPWLAFGYSQVPASPLAGYAPVLGVYGVSATVAASAGLASFAWEALKARARRPLSLALGALAAVWAGGYGLKQIAWTEPWGATLTASLLQGNIPQELKWREDKVASTLATYLKLVQKSSGRLIVLPETALPLFYHQIPADYRERLASAARERGGDLLLGVPEYSAQDKGEYFNSVVSLGASPTQVYRKVHLVPFGEFIPPGFGWIAGILKIPLSDFSRGAPDQQPLEVAGERVAVNICYEDAFGEEIIRQLPRATLLVNVSNDAWFGDSLALWQHLQMSQTRALETGRYALRSTNTGITAVIDAQGRVLAMAKPSTSAVLSHPIQGYTGSTPYVRWGNGPVLVLTAAAIGCALAALRGRVLAAGKRT